MPGGVRATREWLTVDATEIARRICRGGDPASGTVSRDPCATARWAGRSRQAVVDQWSLVALPVSFASASASAIQAATIGCASMASTYARVSASRRVP